MRALPLELVRAVLKAGDNELIQGQPLFISLPGEFANHARLKANRRYGIGSIRARVPDIAKRPGHRDDEPDSECGRFHWLASRFVRASDDESARNIWPMYAVAKAAQPFAFNCRHMNLLPMFDDMT